MHNPLWHHSIWPVQKLFSLQSPAPYMYSHVAPAGSDGGEGSGGGVVGSGGDDGGVAGGKCGGHGGGGLGCGASGGDVRHAPQRGKVSDTRATASMYVACGLFARASTMR